MINPLTTAKGHISIGDIVPFPPISLGEISLEKQWEMQAVLDLLAVRATQIAQVMLSHHSPRILSQLLVQVEKHSTVEKSCLWQV